MNLFVDMLEAAKGWVLIDAPSPAIAGEAKAEKAAEPKDTYEKAENKGNAWDAFVCAFGRGIYEWSTGECEYGKYPNWRR